MKKAVGIFVFVFCAVNVSVAQHSEVRSLEAFNSVDLVGNARIYLINSDTPSVRLEAKKEVHLKEYVTEVRDGVLYLHFKKKDGKNKRKNNKKQRKNKVKIYLSYVALESLAVDGYIRMESDSPLVENELTIKGDGLILGEIKVDVEELNVHLDGFSKLTINGEADVSILHIDGFGKINAKDLKTATMHKYSDGVTRISTN